MASSKKKRKSSMPLGHNLSNTPDINPTHMHSAELIVLVRLKMSLISYVPATV
jgi:hypothetical protein